MRSLPAGLVHFIARDQRGSGKWGDFIQAKCRQTIRKGNGEGAGGTLVATAATSDSLRGGHRPRGPFLTGAIQKRLVPNRDGCGNSQYGRQEVLIVRNG